MDDYVRAYDVNDGRELWNSRLPAGGQATPMTYQGDDGRQYVLVVAGGHGSTGHEARRPRARVCAGEALSEPGSALGRHDGLCIHVGRQRLGFVASLQHGLQRRVVGGPAALSELPSR